jgi:hypothetical protein
MKPIRYTGVGQPHEQARRRMEEEAVYRATKAATDAALAVEAMKGCGGSAMIGLVFICLNVWVLSVFSCL